MPVTWGRQEVGKLKNKQIVRYKTLKLPLAPTMLRNWKANCRLLCRFSVNRPVFWIDSYLLHISTMRSQKLGFKMGKQFGQFGQRLNTNASHTKNKKSLALLITKKRNTVPKHSSSPSDGLALQSLTTHVLARMWNVDIPKRVCSRRGWCHMGQTLGKTVCWLRRS